MLPHSGGSTGPWLEGIRFQGMGFGSCLPRGWLGDEGFPVEPPCSCAASGDDVMFHSRGCDRTLHPFVDEETLALVEDAVESLVCSRGSGPGDAGAVLSALAEGRVSIPVSLRR